MYSFMGLVDKGVYEEQNDDRIIIGSHILTDASYSGKTENSYIVAAVCDGVGGLTQGYRAAMTTLEMVSHLNRRGVTETGIIDYIEIANKRIRNIQCIENIKSGLRTTIAGIYADIDKFIVYNAGDSRVYRFRYRYLSQISKDHSLVQDMVDMGEIDIDEVKTHPQKNIINKCLGNEDIVNLRVIDMSDDFVVGDIILICSDGITDGLYDSEIKEILFEHKNDENLETCGNLLFERAIEKGSKDNISLILIRKDN